MFNKIATIVMALCFIFTSMAFAGGATSTTNPIAGGGSGDVKTDFTYNDGAVAVGGSIGIAENYGKASVIGLGPVSSYANGKAKASGGTDAGAFAYDFGKTSIAGAAIGTEVKVRADGVSGYSGKFGIGGAYNESTGRIEGSVEQCNYVNEVGYASGTFAHAQGHSGASFEGRTKDIGFDADASFKSFNGHADSGICMTGSAFTAGGSIATVDPTGSTQSAFAATANIAVADVRGADCDKTKVYGSGEAAVGAFAQNTGGYALAGGTASFGYKGNNIGGGSSVISATAHVGTNNFSSQACGSSSSFTGSGSTPN